MHINQSGYDRWTWIITLILLLTLSWMLLTGRGPSQACCNDGSASTTSETSTAIDEPFHFEVTASTFSNQGDGSKVSWFAEADSLKTFLAAGGDWQLSGDDKVVTLTGSVASDALKQEKTAELQTFFGPGVTIDNQLQASAVQAVVSAEPPAAAKLFFETGKSTLPAESATILEPTIEWLISHPDAKAVISGYHDARGSRDSNQKLAKARAQASMDALLAAGVESTRIEMRKPIETEGTGNEGEARRVEIAVE
jgi:cytochrome c oxidase subunit 2